MIAAQGYTAFGNIINTTGSSNNILKSTGREQDIETGLYYYNARYYDPLTGMMAREDPMRLGAGVNWYVYANNNPVNLNDPTGQSPLSQTLTDIASTFANYACKPCANALQDAIINAGESGAVIEARANNGGYIFSDAINKNIATNGDHVGEEYNGLVYDNVTPDGLPLSESQRMAQGNPGKTTHLAE